MTPDYEAKIDGLRAAAAGAKLAYDTVIASRKARIEAATLAINEEYREEIAQLSLANMKAEAALETALSTGATHEWEGKIVERHERQPRGSSIWNRTYENVIVRGVVEVCRKETTFAENLSRYDTPKIGTAFVRLLKKDGSPGKKIANLNKGWRLAAGEESK